MAIVLAGVTKCRAFQRNQFSSKVQWKLSQMKDHSTTGQQQRIADQASQNEEKEVYVGSPLTKLRIHAGSLYTSYVYVHTHFHKRKSTYTLEN